jgi:hypothetical protein
MKSKQELRAYQKAYYQNVKKLQLENAKKEMTKHLYIVSIELNDNNKSLIVEL